MYSNTVPRTSLSGPFVLDIPVPGFDGGKLFSQKIAVVTIWNIINLDIPLKYMADWADWARYLTVRLNNSISGTRYSLDAQCREMPI